MISFIKKFLKLEAAGGIVLIFAAIVALIVANSPLLSHYELFRHRYEFAINDGLMVIFFLLIGMEVKRELIEGELASKAQAILPLIAAIGGVIAPALIYVGLNHADAQAMRGWAIPCATDIAFSLAVLSLFGKRIHISLKIFLMALAVIDDIIAVVIIAIFYSGELSLPAIGAAACAMIVLWSMNRAGVNKIMPYMLTGLFLWAVVLVSGVHPTIAGVILGMLIPLELGKTCIHKLHPWVAFFIMPVFAFANSGIHFAELSMQQISSPITLGIALGLFFGKQLGIFVPAWALVRCGYAKLPQQSNWWQFYAVGIIAGIGFTMSLFVGQLAFYDPALQLYVTLGVISGSFVSALVGAALLFAATRR